MPLRSLENEVPSSRGAKAEDYCNSQILVSGGDPKEGAQPIPKETVALSFGQATFSDR